MSDSLAEAAARLEAAVERLAGAASHMAARMAAAQESLAQAPEGGTPAGVPPEEVAALSARLEATIARLRAVLPEGAEIADAEEPEHPDEASEDEAPDGQSDEAGSDETDPGGTGPDEAERDRVGG